MAVPALLLFPPGALASAAVAVLGDCPTPAGTRVSQKTAPRFRRGFLGFMVQVVESAVKGKSLTFSWTWHRVHPASLTPPSETLSPSKPPSPKIRLASEVRRLAETGRLLAHASKEETMGGKLPFLLYGRVCWRRPREGLSHTGGPRTALGTS